MAVYTDPPFHVEVERDRKDGTRFILTNWYRQPLTAYVEEITPVPDGQEGGAAHRFHPVDALIRTAELLSPIPENLSTIQGVSHQAGRADSQPSVVAVVWEDGLTYGSPELIQKLIARRRLSSLYHQHAIDLLQTGLKEGWDANRWVDEGRAREEGLHARTFDVEMDMIVESPLAVAVDNLMQARRDKPENALRVAQIMLAGELTEKSGFRRCPECDGKPSAVSAAHLYQLNVVPTCLFTCFILGQWAKGICNELRIGGGDQPSRPFSRSQKDEDHTNCNEHGGVGQKPCAFAGQFKSRHRHYHRVSVLYQSTGLAAEGHDLVST